MYPKDTFVLSFVFRLSDGRCTDGPQVQIRDQPIGKREAVTRFGRAALPEVSRGSRPEPGEDGVAAAVALPPDGPWPREVPALLARTLPAVLKFAIRAKVSGHPPVFPTKRNRSDGYVDPNPLLVFWRKKRE